MVCYIGSKTANGTGRVIAALRLQPSYRTICKRDLREAYVRDTSLLTDQTCGPAAVITSSTPLNFSKFFTNFEANSAAAAS